MNLNLSEFFVYLSEKKNFYGRLASSMQRVAKPGIGTMAVGLRDGRAVFFWDPLFLKGLSLPSGLFALEHEMLHLVLDHIPRYLEMLALLPTEDERRKAATVYNIAMDCAINTMLRNHEGFEPIQAHLKNASAAAYAAEKTRREEATAAGETVPEMPPYDGSKAGMCLPEHYDLPLEGSFEGYQYLLMRKVQLQRITISFEGNTHGFWTDGGTDGESGKSDGKGAGKSLGEIPGSGGKPKDIIFDAATIGGMSPDELTSTAHRAREQIKDILRQVVRATSSSGRGTLPGNLEEWLEDFLAPPIIPWWEVFASRAKQSRMTKTRRSVQLPNRALVALAEEDNAIIPLPGRLRDRAWRVFVFVDTSGSMSSESLEILKSELHYMLNVDDSMEIRYMQGDCSVQFDELLHAGDVIPPQMLGRGGTDFNVYFEHMKQYVEDSEKAPDLVVVYTDGFAPPVDIENRLPADIPVIWLVTPNHSKTFAEGYGEIIVCETEHNTRRA